MSRTSIVLAAVAGIFMSAAFTEQAVGATHTAAYMNEPVLVFKNSQIKANELPKSIFISGMPLAFSSDIILACNAAHVGNDEMLVFLPRTKRCMTLTSLFKTALDTHPKQAHYSSLQKDRISLLSQLQDESFVVMRPINSFKKPGIMVASTAAEMCICPDDPPVTEDIFIDSFETIIL